MSFFLAKADPDKDYSIQDLERDGETVWDGVHNYQAINFIKTMRPGDMVFIYHSQKQKAIVGLAEVTSKPYENKDDARYSWVVKLKFAHLFNYPVTLTEIKAEPRAKEFKLVTNSRLSTMAVPYNVAAWILDRGNRLLV